MIETMKAAPGAGLAGPQIGVPLRVAVLDLDEKIVVIVNPEIAKRVGRYDPSEGCLSVPGFQGYPTRAERVTVRAKDRHGKDYRISNAEGHFAQALQHEIDHLDGFLYVDRVPTLDDLSRRTSRGAKSADEGGEPPATLDVPLGDAWTPTEVLKFDQYTLPLRAGEVWTERVLPPLVHFERGEGCRMEETHPGKVCAYALDAHGRIMDGRCVEAAAAREKQAEAATS